jgi:uncharacterized damage-inducible protein DinB
MTHDDIVTLLDYHYWARDRLLDAAAALSAEQLLRDNGSSFRSVRDTLAHVYAAEWAWYERWQGRSPKALLAPDQFPDVGAIRDAWLGHETKMRTYLAALDDAALNRVVEYTLFSGATGATPVWKMIQHVVNMRAIIAVRSRRCSVRWALRLPSRWT